MNRTLLASILTLAIVTVPYGAWFITGVSKLDQDELRNMLDIEQEARLEAGTLASQLSVRLEALRRRESERPFYHYQNLYHDPRGAHEGASIVPSPLAAGPADPLIAVHFQVDGQSNLTLPTINDAVPEASAPGDAAQQQQQWRQRLRGATVQIDERYAPTDSMRIAMPRSVWEQIVNANAIYQALRRGEHVAAGKESDETVRITYTPLTWQLVVVEGTPMLAALRWVNTPSGRVTQGFVIPRENAQEWFGTNRRTTLPVQIDSGPADPGQISAQVVGTPWHIMVLVSDAVRQLQTAQNDERAAFMMRFSTSAAAAVVAAICIIYLMRQTERLARERSRFAASAAHELRTPLAGLRMYGEMLAEELGDPAKYKDYARRIVNESERLGRVVSNVLNFSRMDRGKLHVRLEPGGLGPVLRQYIEAHRQEFEKAGIELDLRIADDLPTVRFDRDAVLQVVQNLLDNAEKYSRGSSDRRVQVTLEAMRPTTGLSNVPTGALLTVRDHGPGVEASLRKRMFEPFRRGQRSDAPAGIGLGLTIAHALVKAHRGQISVDNASDGGAVFRVWIPV